MLHIFEKVLSVYSISITCFHKVVFSQPIFSARLGLLTSVICPALDRPISALKHVVWRDSPGWVCIHLI